MVAPQINISVTDLTLYSPRTTNAVMGCVGPATKGAINRLTDFTDEGNFVGTHGIPVDRQYAQRGFIRYLTRGNQGKFVRVAGSNLATALVTLYAADGITPILTVTASSPGSWANDGGLTVAITHNGAQTYNVQVFALGQPVGADLYVGVTNGVVESRINNASRNIRVQMVAGAGNTFPAATINSVTGALQPRQLVGGDDGAFAKSDSASSSTSGVAGRRFFGKMDSVAGSRVFTTIRTIDAALAGLTTAYGTITQPIVPGTFTIRAQTGASAFVELTDNGNLSYTPGGAGLGILTGAAGINGYVDYRTGAYGINILASGSTFFAGGTFGAVFVKAVAESVGATAAGLGAYAGNLSRFKLAPGFFNANKAVITVPINEQVGTAALAAAGAASSVATLKTLAGWIVPGTIILTPAHPTDTVPAPIYDDGLGGWRTAPIGQPGVTVPGTINYRTGVWSVTTWDPVTAVLFPAVTAATIGARYDIQIINMGGGAVPGEADAAKSQVLQPSDAGGDATAASTDPGAYAFVPPVSPGSVILTTDDVGGSPVTIYDDGVGGWLDRPRGDPRAVAVTGSINYATGAWTVTYSAAIGVGAIISTTYTSNPFDQARRSLRGTGPQFVANVTANLAGVDLTAPAVANDYNSTNFLDHTTGEFAIELDLVTTGNNTFNVLDNGTMTAVYMPVAGILGFGDGTITVFTGTLEPAPFRRQANRLVAFQAAQASAFGAGDPQVSFATLGTTSADDHWTQNVAAPTDPDNFLDLRDGTTSIQWTGAPLLDEAVFVAADEVVIHFTSRYPGDIGNERTILTDGLWVQVLADPALAGTLLARVYFGALTIIEQFGLAPTLADLAESINDPLNGSDFIRATVTDDAGIIDADLTAAQSVGMDGAFTRADVVGTKVGSVTTGLQMFRNPDAVALDWIMVPGQWHASVITGLQSLCERKGRRSIGIVPTPDSDDVFQVRDFVNGEYNSGPALPPVPTARVPFPPSTAVDSRLMAVFAPWLLYLDQYTNQQVTEPPDGDMAALVGYTDSVAQPWFPIAGGRRGRVSADAVKYSVELDDQNLVYGQVGSRTEIINVIASFTGRGLQLNGQRTAQRAATSLDRINVSWTINVIMNKLDAGAKEFQFELNDTLLWRSIKSFIESVLAPIKERRGLQDYFVIVDGTTTTAEDIDNLRVRAKIFVKPPRATEYLDFDILLTPTGADFADVASQV
jgi:hypothetical protein